MLALNARHLFDDRAVVGGGAVLQPVVDVCPDHRLVSSRHVRGDQPAEFGLTAGAGDGFLKRFGGCHGLP